jgi:hypothetical protein
VADRTKLTWQVVHCNGNGDGDPQVWRRHVPAPCKHLSFITSNVPYQRLPHKPLLLLQLVAAQVQCSHAQHEALLTAKLNLPAAAAGLQMSTFMSCRPNHSYQ